MQYYRCKCGKCEAWGSMPPYACSGCGDCGTTLDTHAEMHSMPKPHDFSEVEHIKVDQGEVTITRCRLCLRTRDEIEKEWSSQEKFSIEVEGFPLHFQWAQRRDNYPKGWLTSDRLLYVIPAGICTFRAEWADPTGAIGFFGANHEFKTKEDAARAAFFGYRNDQANR